MVDLLQRGVRDTGGGHALGAVAGPGEGDEQRRPPGSVPAGSASRSVVATASTARPRRRVSAGASTCPTNADVPAPVRTTRRSSRASRGASQAAVASSCADEAGHLRPQAGLLGDLRRRVAGAAGAQPVELTVGSGGSRRLLGTAGGGGRVRVRTGGTGEVVDAADHDGPVAQPSGRSASSASSGTATGASARARTAPAAPREVEGEPAHVVLAVRVEHERVARVAVAVHVGRTRRGSRRGRRGARVAFGGERFHDGPDGRRVQGDPRRRRTTA